MSKVDLLKANGIKVVEGKVSTKDIPKIKEILAATPIPKQLLEHKGKIEHVEWDVAPLAKKLVSPASKMCAGKMKNNLLKRM
jgi:hypothetical protein